MLSFLESKNIVSVVETLSSSPYFLNIKHDRENSLHILKHCYRSDKTNDVVAQSDCTILNDDAKVTSYIGPEAQQLDMNDLTDEQVSSFQFHELLDGTMIRLFHHNGEWHFGTRGHTNASKAKWVSEKSFYELWQECISSYEKFDLTTLNTNYTYVFVIQHADNKIVCPVTENKVYLVDVFDNTTLQRVSGEDVGVDSPTPLTFTKVSDLRTFLSLNDETVKGVYVLSESIRGFLLTHIYEERQRLKGNTLDVNRQYLNLRCGNNHTTFVQQFPEYESDVLQLEQNITRNVQYIHQLYMAKHVHKNGDVEIPANASRYLYPIHGFYLRTGLIITRKIVENLMFCINPIFATENLC